MGAQMGHIKYGPFFNRLWAFDVQKQCNDENDMAEERIVCLGANQINCGYATRVEGSEGESDRGYQIPGG